MRKYLFIVMYERNGTLYTLPTYQPDEQHAINFAAEWGIRMHVEIRELKQVSKWTIRNGVELVGEIDTDQFI